MEPVIRFRCPACDYGLRVPGRHAGKRCRCPGCKDPIRIPAGPAGGEAGASPTPGAPDAAAGVRASGKRSRGAPREPAEPAPATRPAGARPRGRAPGPAAAPRGAYALARLGAEPLRLQPGVPVVIGRSRECDLTIPSAKVSRRHAQLTWRGDQPFVKDLGSQNGTRVNGERVLEHRLADGDEVLVGPFQFTFLGPRNPAELEHALDLMVDSEVKTEFTLQDALAGRIEDVTVFEVLQTLEFNRKRGTLELRRRDGSVGVIGVAEGQVLFARLGELEGHAATVALLGWDAGEFRFSPQLAHAPTSRTPITAVLLEAGRRLDERGADEEGA